MLERLARHHDETLRRSALRTLMLTERLRGRRTLEALLLRMQPGPHSGEEVRRVFDWEHHTKLPGDLVRREGQPRDPDHAIEQAYDAAGKTFAFYDEIFGRDSIDDRGMHLISSVHYGREYMNAFWNGVQMVYGDGDGVVFRSFTSCLDIIAHELTHGVTQFEGNLDYEGQPGALNESISDVFGSLVKQWAHRQTVHQADWLIGAGLLGAQVHGRALRSLAAPGTAYDDPELGRDDQPAHMSKYVESNEDDGGVHINSGIPNHAFYLVAMALGGRAWERAGRVWYDAMISGLRPQTDFSTFAAATVTAAKHMDAAVETAVRDAWHRVGVTPKARGRL